MEECKYVQENTPCLNDEEHLPIFRCRSCSRSFQLPASSEICEQVNIQDSINLQIESNADSSINNIAEDVDRKLIISTSFPDVEDDFLVIEELVDPRVAETLTSLTSTDTRVEHPICESCSDNLLDLIDHQLKLGANDCKQYLDFFGHIEFEDNDDLDQLEAELATLQSDEKRLQDLLAESETKKEEVDQVLEAYKRKNQEVNKAELGYYHQCLLLKRQVLNLEDQEMSLDNQLFHARTHLKKIESLNIFDFCFHISDTDQCGVINSFHLGRLPNLLVEWQEINAAWGQATLLMNCLAKKIDLCFKRYRPVPYGNYSYIESTEGSLEVLPLHFSGDEKFVCNTRFDSAMVAFLECLQQLHERLETTAEFLLPHSAQKGRISEGKSGKTYSIRVQFNTEESWTKALKLVLTDLKWALACVSVR